MTDRELYERGLATAVACWTSFARSTDAAHVHRLRHVAAAVFPDEPERSIYNNAILERELAPDERAGALEAMEELYAAAGVRRFSAWGTNPIRRCARSFYAAATPSTPRRAQWA